MNGYGDVIELDVELDDDQQRAGRLLDAVTLDGYRIVWFVLPWWAGDAEAIVVRRLKPLSRWRRVRRFEADVEPEPCLREFFTSRDAAKLRWQELTTRIDECLMEAAL